MRDGYRLVGFAIHLVLIACFIFKEGTATPILPIRTCYHLKLLNAITSYSSVQISLTKTQWIVHILYGTNNYTW